MDRTCPERFSAAEDAFGQALWHWAAGEDDLEVYERPDGYVEAGPGPAAYLSPHRRWPAAERRAIRLARGRTVDVGCGAGRVALHLQREKVDVVSIDSSPLAVRAARRRGARGVRLMTTDALAAVVGDFDTIVLFGNNFGIFGDPGQLRHSLAEWAGRTPEGARILAGSTNPHAGGVPTLDGPWRRHNRAQGRLAGHTDLRIRYRRWSTPWFSWLFVSPPEMRALVAGTGWRQQAVFDATPGDGYVAVLEKDPAYR